MALSGELRTGEVMKFILNREMFPNLLTPSLFMPNTTGAVLIALCRERHRERGHEIYFERENVNKPGTPPLVFAQYSGGII